MNIAIKTFIIIFIYVSLSFSQEERNVMVEIFTNSHCPLCPPAHNNINDYLTSPNGNKINFIFYHMIYPYNDDPLYHHNPIDSDGRDDYYNPIPATPRGFFDGQIQGSTSTWASTLDTLVLIESPLKIILSGTKMEGSFSIKAEITRTGEIHDDDPVIHFVVVEDLDYTGRNGISHHENVMRKMVDGAPGSSFSININETKEVEREVTFHPEWVKDSLKVVVFIQSNSNKTIYQSAIINFSELNDPTNVSLGNNLPQEFKLKQNYPNPFNPSTVISWQLPVRSFVSLIIYDLLGREIAHIVNEEMQPGVYEVKFNGSEFSSGIYYYKLQAGNFVKTKKMTFIK